MKENFLPTVRYLSAILEEVEKKKKKNEKLAILSARYSHKLKKTAGKLYRKADKKLSQVQNNQFSISTPIINEHHLHN